MDFKSILSHLSGPAKENKYFFTEPEIQAQRDAVNKLKMTGVSQMIVEAQENRLRDMEAKKQQPVDKALVEDSTAFLKPAPQPDLTATPDMSPKFTDPNTVPSSFDVHVSDTTVPMNGKVGNTSPIQITPAPQMQGVPQLPPMPPSPDPKGDGSGSGKDSASASSKSMSSKSMDELSTMGDLDNDDQSKRDALARKERQDRIKGLFPNALAGFADVVNASAAGSGVTGVKQSDYLGKTMDIDEKQAKTAKEDLEKRFLTDPNSGMSKVAQSAAARLLGKKPEELANLSLAQIDKAFPIWKEALNNEQAMELKKLQLEAIKATREATAGAKSEKDKEKLIQQFRQNMTGSSAFKGLQEAEARYKQMQSARNNPKAFADLGMMFAFMKSLDPTSVVREGEQDRFIATASMPAAIANRLNKLATGKTLNQQQRDEVFQIAKEIRDNQVTAYRQFAQPTLEQASRLGMNRREIDPLLEDEAESLPLVQSQEDYNKLAVGASYRTADGKTGTKRK